MIHNRKVFFDAKDKLEKDFDLIDVMNQVRKSKNFIKNFLSREQKILLRYDNSNIIDGVSDDEESSCSDYDDVIAKNLQSENALVAMFTLVKLGKILNPYTQVQ